MTRGSVTLDSLRQALADIVLVTRRAFVEFGRDEMGQRSAALAYYALFSIFPLLLVAISVLGFMLEASVTAALDAQAVVLEAAGQTLPQATELIEEALLVARRTRGGTGLVGLIVLVWSASNVFTQARLALNAVWDIGRPQGLSGLLQLRLKALGMTFGAGLLLLIFTLSDTILELLAGYATRLPLSDILWSLGRPLLLACVTMMLFAVLYRIVPRAALSWADVWPGAIVAGIGWEVLKRVFVWYTTSVAEWTAVYGPIAGVIGLLLWLYLAAQVLLFGAEFAASYGRMIVDKQSTARTPRQTEPQVEPDERARDRLGTEPTPREAPGSAEIERSSLAGGTAVGLIGAGVAGGLAVVGLLAAVLRLLTRRKKTGTGEGRS